MFSSPPTHRVISLGGGTQSTAMTLMADQGMFGHRPDLAIFADTGWDPPEVKSNVEWLAGQVSFPIKIVSHSNLEEDLLAGTNSTGHPYIPIPAFTQLDGVKGMRQRQCTREYKIQPIQKYIRGWVGLKPRQNAVAAGIRVEQWLGISLEEVHRVKTTPEKWLNLFYPLVEARLTRQACLDWWGKNAPPDAPPLVRSTCMGCPYQSSEMWLEHSPDRIAQVAKVETAIQQHSQGKPSFLHPRRIPLLEALALDRKEKADNPSLFGEECSGYCGV